MAVGEEFRRASVVAGCVNLNRNTPSGRGVTANREFIKPFFERAGLKNGDLIFLDGRRSLGFTSGQIF